jgi:hypothetical protein
MRDLVELLEENIIPLFIGMILGMFLVWSTLQ